MSNETMLWEGSPLDKIDVRFSSYVAKRKMQESSHMKNGVPDYSFALDYELRQKLNAIPGFLSISKKICATIEARQMQIVNQSGLAVGPNQFPEIYAMAVDCAKRLGIGVPNVFIMNSPVMNAYTYASDDVSPTIVLYSGIIERLTPGELKCVIAHECGHIHNQHTIYQTVTTQILQGVNGNIGMILSAANLLLMQFWTRAGEITADRAALICADDLKDAENANKKLIYGGLLNNDYEVNIDELRKQFEMTIKNPTKILEAQWDSEDSPTDHPSMIRRVLADKEFEECETLYEWRPELKRPGMVLRSKEETELRCKKLINILDN